MVYGAQWSSTVLPGSRFFYCLFFASGPPKPAPEPSPDPPKLPGTAGVLPGPSGKLVYSHTRHQKNTMVYGAQCSSTVLPGSRFFYRLFFASGPPKPAPEPSPNPPKLPGTAGVLPGPSGKLVYSHTRHQKNTMVYGAQCSSTVLPGSRFFYRLFFASGPPKPAPEPMQCNEFAMACTLFRSWW